MEILVKPLMQIRQKTFFLEMKSIHKQLTSIKNNLNPDRAYRCPIHTVEEIKNNKQKEKTSVAYFVC